MNNVISSVFVDRHAAIYTSFKEVLGPDGTIPIDKNIGERLILENRDKGGEFAKEIRKLSLSNLFLGVSIHG